MSTKRIIDKLWHLLQCSTVTVHMKEAELPVSTWPSLTKTYCGARNNMSNRRIVQHAIQSKQNPRYILLQILTNAVKVQRAAWEFEAASLGVPSRGKRQGVSVTLGSITVWFLGRMGDLTISHCIFGSLKYFIIKGENIHWVLIYWVLTMCPELMAPAAMGWQEERGFPVPAGGCLSSLPSESLLPLKPAPSLPPTSAEVVGRTWYSGRNGLSRKTFSTGVAMLQREPDL